jgi:hypothetical protein
MKTIDYDRLASSSPLNKDAALARDGRGEHYDADAYRGDNAQCWDAPPAMVAVPPAVAGLVGVKVGRLTVLGLRPTKPTGKRPASWVVRCVCGTYTTRTARAIKNPANVNDMCARCDRTRILRWRAANPAWLAARKEVG